MRPVLQDQLPGGLVLGVQGVQGHRAAGQVQRAEEFPRHGDFIGFSVNQRAAQIEQAGNRNGTKGL